QHAVVNGVNLRLLTRAEPGVVQTEIRRPERQGLFRVDDRLEDHGALDETADLEGHELRAEKASEHDSLREPVHRTGPSGEPGLAPPTALEGVPGAFVEGHIRAVCFLDELRLIEDASYGDAALDCLLDLTPHAFAKLRDVVITQVGEDDGVQERVRVG